MAFELNFDIHSTKAPWGGSTGEGDIIWLGENLTGATFAWSFTLAQGSAAKFTLSAATAGSQGVSLTWDASYVDQETGEVVGATIIRPQIDETTLEALQADFSSPNTPLALHHDFLVTPSGQPQRVFCFGTASVRYGVSD